MTSVSRIFDHYSDAKAAVAASEAVGIEAGGISIIGRGGDDLMALEEFNPASPLSGGTAQGPMDSLGLMNIPNIGPLAVGGPLATRIAIKGCTGQAIIGALRELEHSKFDSHVLAEALHRGASMVQLRVDDANWALADAVMADNQGTAISERGNAYMNEGWTQYNPDASALTSFEVYNERMRYAKAA